MIDRSIMEQLDRALPSPGPSAAQVLGPPQTEPDHRFADPFEVVAAADLAAEEKRAILASWASDLWAVESAPALRHCPGLPGRVVPLDRILSALRTLDQEEHPAVLLRPGGTTPAISVAWLASQPASP
jgi:hypothetical protein